MRHTQEFSDFVTAHLNDEPSSLRLAFHGKKVPGVDDVESAILQVECRRKFRRKLGETLRAFPDFFFPSKLVAEQSTSDLMARFHAGIVSQWLRQSMGDEQSAKRKGLRLADLTAGLGIDIFHLAALPEVESALAVEIAPRHAEALEFNAAGLGLSHKVKVICADCRNVVAEDSSSEDGTANVAEVPLWDMAFIDPARRDDNGKKVFMLADCKPDLIGMLPDILRKTPRLFVKLSPIIDITEVTRNLPCRSVLVTGTVTECKEVLALVDPEYARQGLQPKVECVTVFTEAERGENYNEEKEGALGFTSRVLSSPDFSSLEISGEYPMPECGMPSVGDFVFEPYPAVMKPGAGSAAAICARLGVRKIAPNTHLYYLGAEEDSLPESRAKELNRYGRLMKVEKVLPYSSKEIKTLYKTYPVAELKTRNFKVKGHGETMKASELQRKLKIKDGSTTTRIFAVTDLTSTPRLIVTKRMD